MSRTHNVLVGNPTFFYDILLHQAGDAKKETIPRQLSAISLNIKQIFNGNVRNFILMLHGDPPSCVRVVQLTDLTLVALNREEQAHRFPGTP